MTDSNSLGLDFDKEDKKKPYVNPDRVKTGGLHREKPSDEELAELMQRRREQNDKIRQRRRDVEADKDAFKQTQEEERVKQAHTRKVQEGVDRAREQNARRKMEKIQSREWDSGKPTDGPKPTKEDDAGQRGGRPPRGARGGQRGRGRGRGRGFGPATPMVAVGETETTTTTTTTSDSRQDLPID